MKLEFLNLLDSKTEQLLSTISLFIGHYESMDDPQKMEESIEILKLTNQLMQWEEDYLCASESVNRALEAYIFSIHEDHKKIQQTLDKMVMLHVDEPDATFINEIKNLKLLLEKHSLKIKNTFTPAMEDLLSPNVVQQLQEQFVKRA